MKFPIINLQTRMNHTVIVQIFISIQSRHSYAMSKNRAKLSMLNINGLGLCLVRMRVRNVDCQFKK